MLKAFKCQQVKKYIQFRLFKFRTFENSPRIVDLSVLNQG